MQVNNIQSNTNFNGIYRIPNTPENIKLISEKVLPMYQMIRREPVAGYPGDNPLVLGMDFFMDILGRKNGGSKEWLAMNARNNGVKFPEFNMDFLHIVAGKKDLNKFIDYFTERIKAHNPNKFQKFLNFFKAPEANGYKPEMPEHLQPVCEALHMYRKERDLYSEFIKGKEIVQVNTPQELLTRMMNERM